MRTQSVQPAQQNLAFRSVKFTKSEFNPLYEGMGEALKNNPALRDVTAHVNVVGESIFVKVGKFFQKKVNFDMLGEGFAPKTATADDVANSILAHAQK